MDFANAVQSVFDGRFVPQMSVEVSNGLWALFKAYYGEDAEDWTSWWLYECDGIQGDLTHDWYTRSREEDEEEDRRNEGGPLCAFHNGQVYAPRTAVELWNMINIFDIKG